MSFMRTKIEKIFLSSFFVVFVLDSLIYKN